MNLSHRIGPPQSADLLNLQKSKDDLDDAISILASWMQLNAHELTEDDFVALTLVGGIIYREGLYRGIYPKNHFDKK